MAGLRIGELSRRAGVSPELLRAWERRYGLLRPARSSGGLRLYGEDDVVRVRRMREHLAQGLAAAEAAAAALQDTPTETAFDARAERAALAHALESYDEPRAQALLDRLLAAATLETVLADVVLPYLRELGERWQRGEVSVAQEHLASTVIRGRLLGLARGWGQGVGPVALLACPPGERHDLGLIAFGLLLRGRGWRVHLLGADTPLESVGAAADALQPDLVVLSSVLPDVLAGLAQELAALAARHRTAVGGAGALGVANVELLPADAVAAAEHVSATPLSSAAV